MGEIINLDKKEPAAQSQDNPFVGLDLKSIKDTVFLFNEAMKSMKEGIGKAAEVKAMQQAAPQQNQTPNPPPAAMPIEKIIKYIDMIENVIGKDAKVSDVKEFISKNKTMVQKMLK